MNLHTIHLIRRAHKNTDGVEGLLYLHQWPTGFQELVFEREELARQFLDKLNGSKQDDSKAQQP